MNTITILRAKTLRVVGFWDVLPWILVVVHGHHVSEDSNFKHIFEVDIFCKFMFLIVFSALINKKKTP
jgi:hypothetical protein